MTSSPLDEVSQPESTPVLSVTIFHHGKPHDLSLLPSSTINDLSIVIEAQMSIPIAHQKFLITPKIGILTPPFSTSPALPLQSLLSKKITLLGPTAAEFSALSQISSRPSSPSATSRSVAKAQHTPQRRHDAQKAFADATYTFHTLLPLPYLPSPQRSLAFLERLRSDPGIRATMTKHRFSVGVLTEMNPADHTTHESRTLGLNRNRGEVIELRLRTDAYDGYRDYKIIRKTLCHELAHNVFGEHDRQFWDLCGQIEKEVERGDWKSGGRALTEEVFFDGRAGDTEEHIDGGGWTGGEFVLGGGSTSSQAKTTTTTAAAGQTSIPGLSRRDLLARAAEERMKRQRDAERGGGGGGGVGGEGI